MQFSPKQESELNNFVLFPKGDYDFEVIKAHDKTSMSGNDMIELELDIFDSNGNKCRVYDYLLEKIAYKLKHFCDSVGLTTEYEKGTLVADMCLNRNGKCRVDIKHDNTGVYSDKNIIKDYLPADIDKSDLPF